MVDRLRESTAAGVLDVPLLPKKIIISRLTPFRTFFATSFFLTCASKGGRGAEAHEETGQHEGTDCEECRPTGQSCLLCTWQRCRHVVPYTTTIAFGSSQYVPLRFRYVSWVCPPRGKFVKPSLGVPSWGAPRFGAQDGTNPF